MMRITHFKRDIEDRKPRTASHLLLNNCRTWNVECEPLFAQRIAVSWEACMKNKEIRIVESLREWCHEKTATRAYLREVSTLLAMREGAMERYLSRAHGFINLGVKPWSWVCSATLVDSASATSEPGIIVLTCHFVAFAGANTHFVHPARDVVLRKAANAPGSVYWWTVRVSCKPDSRSISSFPTSKNSSRFLRKDRALGSGAVSITYTLATENSEIRDRFNEIFHATQVPNYEYGPVFSSKVGRWLEGSGALRKRFCEGPNTYADLVGRSASELPLHVREQIAKDIPRICIRSEAYTEEMKTRATRILEAYAMRNIAIRYCQGMNSVCAFFLLEACGEEEAAFWLVAAICEDMLPDRFSNQLGLIGYTVDDAAFMGVLAEALPDISRHLANTENFLSMTITMPWFNIIFIGSLDRHTLLCLIDALFAAPHRCAQTLFQCALAILDSLKERILCAKSIDKLIPVLKSTSPYSLENKTDASISWHDIRIEMRMFEANVQTSNIENARRSALTAHLEKEKTRYEEKRIAVLARSACQNLQLLATVGIPFTQHTYETLLANISRAVAHFEDSASENSRCKDATGCRPQSYLRHTQFLSAMKRWTKEARHFTEIPESLLTDIFEDETHRNLYTPPGLLLRPFVSIALVISFATSAVQGLEIYLASASKIYSLSK